MKVYGRIYGVECLVEHKIYVGQTTRDVETRINEHKHDKRNPLGQTILKYGWEGNFVWVVLEECYSREELNEGEKRWIKKLSCQYPNGFNRTSGGTKDFNLCEETLKKMSEVQRNREYGPEFGEKVAERNRNSPPEFYRKTSATKKQYRFYPNLEAEIEKNNLTHRKLARLLGITKSTMYYKLIGKGKISPELKRAIKEILQTDLSIEELFKHED